MTEKEVIKGRKLIIGSLGWGVQSWTLAAMSALGELPTVDFVIHSDTTFEYQRTYKFVAQWTPWLAEHGIRVVTVSGQSATKQVQQDKYGGVFIPAYTYDLEANINGQLRRQCTGCWKIQPMRRFITKVIQASKCPPEIIYHLYGEEIEGIIAKLDQKGIRNLKKTPGVIEQWLGITKDEWQRAKDSNVQYIQHKYPLLDMNMTRRDCLNWLEAHNLPSPGKSSCTFCPYHSKRMWQELKRENGPDWAQAVLVDETIRNKRPPYSLFVHQSGVPLNDAVKVSEDYGATQLSLFNDDKSIFEKGVLAQAAKIVMFESQIDRREKAAEAGLDYNDNDAECDSGYCFL